MQRVRVTGVGFGLDFGPDWPKYHTSTNTKTFLVEGTFEEWCLVLPVFAYVDTMCTVGV